jgi:hypothetical protein
VGVLIICALLFTVFCIICTLFCVVSFMYNIFILLCFVCLSVRTSLLPLSENPIAVSKSKSKVINQYVTASKRFDSRCYRLFCRYDRAGKKRSIFCLKVS